jgi:type IV pilus assembly protein PilO
MPDLRQTRTNIKRALVVMVAADVLALAIYISPLVGSTESRRQEIVQLQTELSTKTAQVAPLKDLPQKVQLAGRQIGDFYKKRIPEQESQVVSELGKVASESGIKIEQVKYKIKEAGPGGLAPVETEAELSGSYTSLARFINGLERDDMFFIINSVTLAGEPQGPVKLNVKLDAFLKTGFGTT